MFKSWTQHGETPKMESEGMGLQDLTVTLKTLHQKIQPTELADMSNNQVNPKKNMKLEAAKTIYYNWFRSQ